MKKIIISIILIVLFIFCIANTVNAEAFINADTYKPSPITSGGKIQTIGNMIIGGIQFIGSIVSVIVLIIIGIKYMIGSVEEKAEYKQSMVPYLIGAVMLFALTNLLAIISSLFG